MEQTTLVLRTDVPRVVLRKHSAADAAPYYELVQANSSYLTRHGDYTELVAASREDTERGFTSGEPSLRFGIWKDDSLIGHVTLVHREPPRWGLGFWLAEHATGHGYMAASITALLAHARRERGAAEVLAGVTHGNDRSVAVLIRLGFTLVTEFETYSRYRKVLAEGP